jgi:hypothetical protein
MRLISATIIAIGMCFAATGASAAYFSSSQLAKVQAIKVEVTAAVEDGCLDYPDALKTETELILRQSGIKVVEDDSGHTLDINVVSYAITGGCSAHVSLQTYVFETLTDGTSGLVEASNQGTLISGPKGGFPQQLRAQVNAKVSKLANEILKARQK